MADIKTRQSNKGTIKTLDRAVNLNDHMRTAYTKTKNSIESVTEEDRESISGFAVDKLTGAMREGADIGKTANVNIEQKTFRKLRTKQRMAGRRTRSAIHARSLVNNKEIKTAAYLEKKYAEKTAKRQFEHAANNKLKRTARETRRAVRNTAKAIKAAINGTKALIAAIASGGWIAIIVILICCLFGAAFYYFGDESSKNYTPVSAEVEAYTPLIQKYAKQYGIGEYVELIKAVMMQESGGRGNDPMQASESSFNSKYSKSSNGIENPEYSIDCGVQELSACIKQAGCKNPLDMSHIRLALQGYNYGRGYIDWAIKRDGGYTVENADAFSDEQAKSNGSSSYGDKQYVAHVLKYYPYGSYNYGVGNTAITKVAADQVGNKGGKKFWSWYGFSGRVEWCAIYVSWCADQCGYIQSGTIPKFANVQTGISWFKNKGEWQKREYTPRPGDIIFFDWRNDGRPDHVGIVEKCDGNTIYTIEGNSGDQCRKRNYSVRSNYIYGYGVPKY